MNCVAAAVDSRKSALHPNGYNFPYSTKYVPTQKKQQKRALINRTPSAKVNKKKITVSKKSEENKPVSSVTSRGGDASEGANGEYNEAATRNSSSAG